MSNYQLPPTNPDKRTHKVEYRGSWAWLIFWVIVFFPIALALFFTRCSFTVNGMVHHFEYEGSRFWLCFWLVAFFPVALVLFFLNGFSSTSNPSA